ncbi:MAG: hypothetical protein LH603_10235 [Pseudonocardia sp.]|nr:hypothetical protein [Pseudonocardia sp.]
MKATGRQLSAGRDEFATMIEDAPSTPDPATLDYVADHLAEIIANGTPNQRKALVEALIARVIIIGPASSSRCSASYNPNTAPGLQQTHQRNSPGDRGSHTD